LLAPCKQIASAETETEKRQIKESKASLSESKLSDFDTFWEAYDKKVDRPASERAWKKANVNADIAVYVVDCCQEIYRSNARQEIPQKPGNMDKRQVLG